MYFTFSNSSQSVSLFDKKTDYRPGSPTMRSMSPPLVGNGSPAMRSMSPPLVGNASPTIF